MLRYLCEDYALDEAAPAAWPDTPITVGTTLDAHEVIDAYQQGEVVPIVRRPIVKPKDVILAGITKKMLKEVRR